MLAPFVRRHVGPSEIELKAMLASLGFSTLDELTRHTVPASIRFDHAFQIPAAASEHEALAQLKKKFARNKSFRSYIGTGYSDTLTPTVILRNVLENPGWYTQYTPYQAEIAQGRLEALLNFQTLVSDLTGLAISNASLLDEGTAVAEAMHLAFAAKGEHETKGKTKKNIFFVSELCHPQTIEVTRTRAEPLGIQVVVGDHTQFKFDASVFGAVFQYPATDGSVIDYSDVISKVKVCDALAIVATDLLALTLLRSPAEMGADIAVGNSQRFGVPMGFGGPHAAFFATHELYKRQIPGRLVGVSVDTEGHKAYRLALQTREQHIRREKATSNICTAQVLLAVIASLYAVYHGPEGLKQIASDLHNKTRALATALAAHGWKLSSDIFFDTITCHATPERIQRIKERALQNQINFRYFDNKIGISLDEATTAADLDVLADIFGLPVDTKEKLSTFSVQNLNSDFGALSRTSRYLTHPVFSRYHSETEMLRYIFSLMNKDLSLTGSMIPLGSCTMKLNATSEMLPVTWPEVGRVHPFAPLDQVAGYIEMFHDLENWLSQVTGFDGVSLQPNAGSQGEYAGLLVIRHYHHSRNETHRDVCLIPTSAHGTNPASAVMAGMKVIAVACDAFGNIDLTDLKKKIETHQANLAALMVTYPSTHGVFEESIRDICRLIHEAGGQVYLDGANMNAQIGLCQPGEFGADVCHLNLHKTFCIPHGGGGPGMGPICVKSHLKPFLPTHSYVSGNDARKMEAHATGAVSAVSAAPWGSASILPISWMYIAMMGGEGLKFATEVAILNANYMAKRLAPYFPVLYKGREGLVAHECIIDLRGLQNETGITVEDVAKRLMDYGFHAPTVSWPVIGTMMIEPTESESKIELDRFCDAMISIHAEIVRIKAGTLDKTNNMLKRAPHTASAVCGETWDRPYTRKEAAFPAAWQDGVKFWPAVSRIDSAFGDRNLICSCPPWGEAEKA